MPVAGLVVHPPHSLVDQCTASREQTSGTENPDGWGIGWYVEDQADPYRYRTSTPMPLDQDGVAAIEGLESGRFVAHVRHRSPGSPVETAGNAPFVEGRWLFAHNGFVAGFRDGVDAQLRERVSAPRLERLDSQADSEVLFALIMDRIDAGDDPMLAVAAVIEPLSGPERDQGKFNVMLTDGNQLVASRWGNSLHLRIDDLPNGRAVVIASEPYDDVPTWETVTDHTLVRVHAEGVDRIPC